MSVKILVVDDEPNNLKMIASRLKASGYEVLTAGDAEGGYELARNWRPDVAVTDWELAGMGGDELCRKLKMGPDTHAVRVILYTARVNHGDEGRAREAGCDAFIQAPFKANVLLAKVRGLVETSHE